MQIQLEAYSDDLYCLVPEVMVIKSHKGKLLTRSSLLAVLRSWHANKQ